MSKKGVRITIGAFLLLCVMCHLSAQYEVTGGKRAPLKVVDDQAHKIEVYLVDGMEGVTITYHGGSEMDQWCRYQTKALDYEEIPSYQQGNSSVVQHLQGGYGYFVKSDHLIQQRYLWIIDFSDLPLDLFSLYLSEKVDPCRGFRLEGEAEIAPLYYTLPIGGRKEVVRSFEVSYLTQQWNEQTKQFARLLWVDTIQGNPFGRTLIHPPKVDTEIELTGDLFARYFEKEQTVKTNLVEASAIEVYGDTLVLSDSKTNMSVDDKVFSAPLDIRFTAYANTPVASFFVWTIYRDGKMDEPLARFNEQEVEYHFDQAGEYLVQLEVSDRKRICDDNKIEYRFSVSETEMLVPNVFSPEGSLGINDEFRVAHKSVMEFKAWIFNRWGSQIYFWNDPDKGWDGKYRGQYVPSGPYFYVIEYKGTDGKRYKKSGDINVLRSKEKMTNE